MGAGSGMAVDVESLRYSHEATQRVTADFVGFLRGDKGLRYAAIEERRGIE